jgi:hypothetical protein
MADQKPQSSQLGKSLKLFLTIFLLLLVPIAMDQTGVERETVRLVGRVAAGLTLVLFGYGVISKLFKVLGFLVVILIGLVVLIAEGQLDVPRVKDFFAERTEQRSPK